MQFSKLIAAIVGTVALAVQTALADGGLSTEDFVVIGSAALAAFGTWLVPNTPVLATAKLWVSALVLAAGVAVPLIQDGVTTTEWMTILIALLTAAGVYVAPKPGTTPVVPETRRVVDPPHGI